MADDSTKAKVGAAGILAALAAAFAHGADDCARAGARVGSHADDIARVAPVAAGELAPGARAGGRLAGAADDIGRTGVHAGDDLARAGTRRSAAFGVADDPALLPHAERAGDDVAEHSLDIAENTLDAVDLLLDSSGPSEGSGDDGAGETPSSASAPAALPLQPSFVNLTAGSSKSELERRLVAARADQLVFVLGAARPPEWNGIWLGGTNELSIAEIGSGCTRARRACIVLACEEKALPAASRCLTSARSLVSAAVAAKPVGLVGLLRDVLAQRKTRGLTSLAIHRVASTPDGLRMVRSRLERPSAVKPSK